VPGREHGWTCPTRPTLARERGIWSSFGRHFSDLLHLSDITIAHCKHVLLVEYRTSIWRSNTVNVLGFQSTVSVDIIARSKQDKQPSAQYTPCKHPIPRLRTSVHRHIQFIFYTSFESVLATFPCCFQHCLKDSICESSVFQCR
jgi:hypothetical protein